MAICLGSGYLAGPEETDCGLFLGFAVYIASTQQDCNINTYCGRIPINGHGSQYEKMTLAMCHKTKSTRNDSKSKLPLHT